MRRFSLPAAIAACLFASQSMAEPTVGLGLSFVFGQGGAPETGVGVRLLSDNDKGHDVFTGGVDYLISNNRWRGTVGVARKLSKSYVGVDLGFGLRGEGMDLGLSVGGAAK